MAAAEAADVREKCLTRFASSDFIMEPEIFSQLKTYFQVGSIWADYVDMRRYVFFQTIHNITRLTNMVAGLSIQGHVTIISSSIEYM